ncbi:MAG: MFS transporter [Campylobacter sp.]|nr:MFS transporter [Campylobacter sp.]
MKNPFLSLKYRNFRIYWVGMNLSLIGSWMQVIALPWLTLIITNDPFKVSLVATLQFAPALLFTLFSGAILDRFNKKAVLAFAQIGMMIIAFIFAFMVFTDSCSFEKLLIFSFINGVFNSIDAPSRQSMVYDLIDDRENLPNAIALNSVSFNTARILGPSLAGIIMAVFGVGYCFLFNGVSFFAILISLYFIKLKTEQKAQNSEPLHIFKSIKEGFIYVLHKQILSEVLLILLIIATFVPNYNITVSAFVKFVLQGGEKTFGYMMACSGVGAFVGAFFVASFGKFEIKYIRILSVVSVLLLSCIGLVSNFYYACFVLALTGFAFLLTASNINSTLQLNTANEFRGRVMSIYTLVFQGSTPFGALFAGYFTDKFGAKFGFIMCGVVAAILLLVLFNRKRLRRKIKTRLN